jgi:hypothetical protein
MKDGAKANTGGNCAGAVHHPALAQARVTKEVGSRAATTFLTLQTLIERRLSVQELFLYCLFGQCCVASSARSCYNLTGCFHSLGFWCFLLASVRPGSSCPAHLTFSFMSYSAIAYLGLSIYFYGKVKGLNA